MYVKQYLGNKVLGWVVCRDTKNSIFLREHQQYKVIDETETQFLIRFGSGGAKWYSKARFQIIKKTAERLKSDPITFKPEKVVQLTLNLI